MSKCESPIAVERGSRREFLGDVGMALAGALLPVTQVLSAAQAANSYPANDVRHYGVVPNNAAAATANTAALTALVSPSGSFSGDLVFPNAGGQDVYYFNDMIPFHDGVHIKLMNSTLNFSKVGVAHDTNAGFLHAIRDFSVEDGSIIVDYTHKAGFNTGNALSFGGRGDDTALFPNIYDSLLTSSMGKIAVRNLRISSNAGGGEGRGILMLGGLDGVLFENVTIDGQGQLIQGIYYEFGWATNEPKPFLRETSHGHNFQIKNLTVTGVKREGFAANGLYTATIDGIKVSNSGGVCAFGSGESMFFRVWSGVGDRNTKPNIIIRNAVGNAISGVGIGVTGANNINNSFLDNPPAHNNPKGLRVEHQTDLIDFTLDTFTISGTANNYGVSTSARRAIIRNGTLTGFQRGVVTTQECTKFLVENVHVFDSTGLGMQIGQAVSLHNPPRLASGVVRGCVVAGSGTVTPSVAISVSTTQNCVIESCRFGYDQSHDHKTETTQSQAVVASADASEVICRDNYVGSTAKDAPAYTLVAAPSGARGCRIENNAGVVATTGPWLTGRQGLAMQTVADAGKISTTGMPSIWVTATAPATGVSVQPGVEHGHAVVIVHDGATANSIEFGPQATSNVEDGAKPIAGRTSRVLIWNAENHRWHSLD
jgi:hypothetical protein